MCTAKEYLSHSRSLHISLACAIPNPPSPNSETTSTMKGSAFSQKTVNESSRTKGCTVTIGSNVRDGLEAEATTKVYIHRPNEKEELQQLNNRFSGYIDKVRSLEQKNKALREEIEERTMRLKERGPGIADEYEKEFKELKELIEKLNKEKNAADIERGNLEEEIDIWNAKCDEELFLKGEEKACRNLSQYNESNTFCFLNSCFAQHFAL